MKYNMYAKRSSEMKMLMVLNHLAGARNNGTFWKARVDLAGSLWTAGAYI